jgi:hypothetical protein
LAVFALDLEKAFTIYHNAERLKIDLINLSKLITALMSFKGSEKPGAKRMLMMMTDMIIGDLKRMYSITNDEAFGRAAGLLEQANKEIDEMRLGPAAETVASAISEVTTPAAGAWEPLHEKGLF